MPKKFEYKIFQKRCKDWPDLIDWLNDKGRDGWQVVSMINLDDAFIITFMRELE